MMDELSDTMSLEDRNIARLTDLPKDALSCARYEWGKPRFR
jgi:hypothetical protein